MSQTTAATESTTESNGALASAEGNGPTDPVEIVPIPPLPPDPPPVISPPWGNTTKALVASISVILVSIVIWRFNFLITPLVLAAILAYLLNPIITWLQGYLHLKRGHAVAIIYLVFLLLWVGGGVVLGFVLVDQVLYLSDQLPGLVSRLVVEVPQWVQSWSSISFSVGPYQIEPGGMIGPDLWTDLANELRAALQSVLGRGGALVATVASATLSGLALGFLVLIVSIYFSIDAPKVGRTISNLAKQPGYQHDAERLLQENMAIWDAYLRGQITLALVIGVVVGLLLTLLGVSNALALGVAAGILEFLPVVGPVLSAVFAVAVAVFQSETPFGLQPWSFGLIVLVVMFLVQQVENYVLVPRIVGDALDLHPVEVMVVVLMGSSLAGLLGAVLAAPVFASIKLIGGYVWRKMLDLPPFPEPEKPRVKSEPSAWSKAFAIFGEHRHKT